MLFDCLSLNPIAHPSAPNIVPKPKQIGKIPARKNIIVDILMIPMMNPIQPPMKTMSAQHQIGHIRTPSKIRNGTIYLCLEILNICRHTFFEYSQNELQFKMIRFTSLSLQSMVNACFTKVFFNVLRVAHDHQTFLKRWPVK